MSSNQVPKTGRRHLLMGKDCETSAQCSEPWLVLSRQARTCYYQVTGDLRLSQIYCYIIAETQGGDGVMGSVGNCYSHLFDVRESGLQFLITDKHAPL